MLVFREADASAMSEVFAKKAALMREFVPDVRDGVVSSVGDWTGEARTACDAALERLVGAGRNWPICCSRLLARWTRSGKRAFMLRRWRSRISMAKGAK